ncbi:hypothetical protein B0H11DRAFT_1883113, partial [Mycena galericulata]
MSTQPKFAEIKDALLEGVKSLKKWFHRTDTTSSAYFICLVLNPNIKDVYFRSVWGSEEFNKGMRALEEVFDRYYAEGGGDKDVEISPAAPAAVQPAPLHRYG